MNNVCISGKIKNDLELKETSNGSKVVNLELEVSRCYPNSDGEFDRDIFSVTLWKEMAEKSQEYCKKGDLVEVKGRLTARSFNTKNDKSFYYSEIVAENLIHLNLNS